VKNAFYANRHRSLGKEETMMRVDARVGGVMVAVIALSACAPAVLAPTVPVMPGPNKPFDQFAADQQTCQAYANGQVAPLTAQANNQALGGTLLTTVLGAGLGAAIGGGRGAAIGAGAGAITGAGAGAANAQDAGNQAYWSYYNSCMASRTPAPAPSYQPGYGQPQPGYGQQPYNPYNR
jgi:outer membrane lipoprotein SlyB